ncbi:MAG: (Fe-S)-binding protein [Dokdonella sp.]
MKTVPRTRTLRLPAQKKGVVASAVPIAVFEGCVASEFDRDTLAATRLLLERLGHRVVTSNTTLCCGALPRHAGHASAADAISGGTRRALEAIGTKKVVVSASGCYGALAENMRGSGTNVVDAAQCIADHLALASLRFKPLQKRAALHLPCSQVNGSHSVDATRALLSRIPGLTLIELPNQPRCCGAAGSYFLEHPQIADDLRDQRLNQIEGPSQPPDLLLTSNIGCRIHLGNGLRERGSTVPVLHPLTLLAQQLEME